jgi:TRAP-type C4-dicarboxylate transport system substrate-binding protein
MKTRRSRTLALWNLVRAACPAALLAMAALGAPSPGAAQTTLDVAVFHTDRDTFAEALRNWAAGVERATQGRVRLRGHFAGSLVSLTETLNAVRDGVVPLGTSSAAVASGQVPPLAFIEPTGGIPGTPEEFLRAADALQPVLETLMRGAGVQYIWMQPAFNANVTCREKHLRTAEDWRGTRIRVAGRWQSEQIRALGAVPVVIDVGELYVSLQNRTVDCTLANNGFSLSLRLYEVAPFITQLRLPSNVVLYIANPAQLERLSAADRAALMSTGREAQAFGARYVIDQYDRDAETLRQRGANYYVLNDQELAFVRGAIRPVFQRIREAVGAAGEPVASVLQSSW